MEKFILSLLCKYLAWAEPEPADLQWSGRKFELDYNLLICHGIHPCQFYGVCGYIASYIAISS